MFCYYCKKETKENETCSSCGNISKYTTETTGISWKYRKRNQLIIKDDDPIVSKQFSWWREMENDTAYLSASYIAK